MSKFKSAIALFGGKILFFFRFKNRYGKTYEWCPHCEVVHGKKVALRESHVLFCCPAVARQRRSLKISAYKAKAVTNGQRTPQSVLRAYLGGDGAPKMVLLERGRRMAIVIEAWLLKIHEYPSKGTDQSFQKKRGESEMILLRADRPAVSLLPGWWKYYPWKR